jgi:tetratricopeptide (TPR) repeat protein
MNINAFYMLLRSLFIIVLISTSLFIQAQNIDSLKAVLMSSKDKQRCDILFKLALGLAYKNNSLSLGYAVEGHRIAILLRDTLRIVKGGRILGQAYRRVDSLNASTKILDQVLAIAIRNQKDKLVFDEYKRVLSAKAIVYLLQADYANALEYSLRCLKIREPEGDDTELAVLYNNIGLVYYKLFNAEKALFFILKH